MVQYKTFHQARICGSLVAHMHPFHHVQVDWLTFFVDGQHSISDDVCELIRELEYRTNVVSNKRLRGRQKCIEKFVTIYLWDQFCPE